MAQKATYLESEDLYGVMELLYLRIGELMVTLAPEGWNKSPYHFPFVPIENEHDILYSSYKVVAQAYERQFGQCPRVYLEEAEETVGAICKANRYDARVGEMVYLIEFALVRLTQNGLFFKTNDPAHYYIIDECDVAEQSDALGMEMTLPDVAYPSMPAMSRARHDLLYHLDLSVLYANILDTFWQLNYDWRYSNETLEYQWVCWQVASNMNWNDGKYSQQKLLSKLNELIACIARAHPPDEVIGYICTHDRLPSGYPPTLENIKQLTL